jgi:arginine-tRNA-protein transferase
MLSLNRYLAPSHPCGYLPAETARMEYEHFLHLSPGEYLQRMRRGWRRFGSMLFRPQCEACNACQSLRVPVATFRPNRSQRRARKANEADVRIVRGKPSLTAEKLRLYDRYHAFQTEAKGWPAHPRGDLASYRAAFVENPFPTQEWCYFVQDRLIGVGFVDDLPASLSAMYFYYDPDERHRSLGTWNVLSLLDYAATRAIPHVYLGYFVAGSQSLEYKGRFGPNERLGPDGQWRPVGAGEVAGSD